VRVALAQLDAVLGDVEGNLASVHRAAAAAAARSADLLVFPELFLSGYRIGEVGDCSVEPGDPRILDALTVDGRPVAAVLTMTEREGPRRFNSAAYYEGGRLVRVQRKVYLVDYPPFDEHLVFDAGESAAVIEVAGHPASILICNDAWHSERTAAAVARGAELLIVPVNSAISEYSRTVDTRRRWSEITVEAALTLGVPVVMVNRVGLESGLRFFGESRAVAAGGEVLATGPLHEEAVLIADLEVGPRT
jgi:predicted amidohydrolase